MCGIVGAITKNGAISFDLANLLEYVQHRGQDTAGIATIDRFGHPHLYKKPGLVTTIFTPEILQKELPGITGVGHTRYKTIGVGGERNAQPFYTHSPDGAVVVGIAHNGHIRNYDEQKKMLEAKGIKLESDCDVEPILYRFTENLNEKSGPEEIFAAARKTMDEIVGAYSVVAAVRNNRTDNSYLVVFRDAHAIRPCVIGRKEEVFAAASESLPLENNGFKEIYDVAPGEVFIADNKLNIESRIVKNGERKHCFFEWVYFADAASTMEGIDIEELRAELGKRLAYENKDLEHKIDVVTFVPQTPISAAIEFARYHEKDCIPMEKYRFAGRNFLKPTQEQREKDTAKNLIVFRRHIMGKRVAVIDDSIVRGTTSRQVVQALRDAEAKTVHILSTTPPIRHPCELGINTPTYEELIAAHDRKIEDIEGDIGADSVRYLSINGLLEALSTHRAEVTKRKIAEGKFSPKTIKELTADSFCTSCLTGKNPTQQELEEFRARTKPKDLVI